MPKPRGRKCAQCKQPIYECMGFVKAGDVLENRRVPRELCGKCVLVWEWTPEGELVKKTPPTQEEHTDGTCGQWVCPFCWD